MDIPDYRIIFDHVTISVSKYHSNMSIYCLVPVNSVTSDISRQRSFTGTLGQQQQTVSTNDTLFHTRHTALLPCPK
jgi:hypothetical protein